MNSAKPRRRGRLYLLLLIAGLAGPMLLASAMYRWQFWVPDERSYHGTLIGNGQVRADLGVQADERRWQLLVSAPQACQSECVQLLYLARQVQTALGRDAGRASQALASGEAPDAELTNLIRQHYPRLQRYPLDTERYRQAAPGSSEAQLWIIDPHGNLVLRYGADISGKALLEDLRHLLKLSHIG